jgi:hypothetical protein
MRAADRQRSLKVGRSPPFKRKIAKGRDIELIVAILAIALIRRDVPRCRAVLATIDVEGLLSP